jgi:hypothetical protein
MTETQKIPWKRIGIEASAIVASILLAFAIDAWWEERQDRKMERDDLERLHAEFIWNRDRVNDNGAATRAEAASAEMSELLVAHLGQDGPLEIQNTQFENVRSVPTFDAVTPVLDGLILSGRLDNIRDQEVLLAISWWQRHLQQVEETEIGARQFLVTQLVPALAKRGNMGLTYRNVDADGVTAVTVDEELVALVAHRAGNTKNVIHALDNLKNAANNVVVAVEQAQNE